MTARQLFEYALIELNKVQAPSLILEDYNYFINKAVNQYINRVYNLYDVNQQKSDDLRVLKSSAVLTPKVLPNTYGTSALLSKAYEVELPDDYLHILNCVVEYNVTKAFKCYDPGTPIHFGAKRLTGDMWAQVINNYYMRPQYKNPYYYINNVTVDSAYPTTDSQSPLSQDLSLSAVVWTAHTAYSIGDIIKIFDGNLAVVYYICTIAHTSSTSPNLDNFSLLGGSDRDTQYDAWPNFWYKFNPYQREPIHRYGNSSKVRMEIRYGKDNTLFALSQVYVDYLKAPQFIRLTQEQVDEVEDNSQLLEFPDYVNQEIVNELIKLLMENASDPRLQTNIPINQSIANPAQEQQKR